MKFDLKEILERYNNLNSQLRYAIVVVFFTLIIALDFLLVLQPQINALANNNQQITDVTTNIQQVLNSKGQVKSIKGKLELSKELWLDLNHKMRRLQEVPAILSTIASIANENAIKIDQLSPQKSQEKLLSKKAPKNGVSYYVLPIDLKLRGGYHQFGGFLNRLENERIFFILKKFIIQNDVQNIKSHIFTLTLNVFLVDAKPGKSL